MTMTMKFDQSTSSDQTSSSSSFKKTTPSPSVVVKEWMKQKQGTNVNSSSSSSSSFPGQNVKLSLEGLPDFVIKDIAHTKTSTSSQFPFPRESAHPETFMYLAQRIAPLIPACFADPYRSWVSVPLSLTHI